MIAERQKQAQHEKAYANSTDGSTQTHLATARQSSIPATAPLLGFIAALMAAGMGLVSRNGTKAPAPIHQPVQSRRDRLGPRSRQRGRPGR